LLNQMRWKTCFSRILMLKVRRLDVLLTPAKGSDNKHLWVFHNIGWMKVLFLNLIWMFEFSCWCTCSVNTREWCWCKFLENSLLRRICEFKKKEVMRNGVSLVVSTVQQILQGCTYWGGWQPEHTQCAWRRWYKV
jgi:hypothetical protein